MPTFRLISEPIEAARADLLALPMNAAKPGPGAEAVAKKLGADLKELLEQHRFKGELGDALSVPTFGKLGAKQVLFVGLGAEPGGGEIRKAGAVVARRAGTARTVATSIAGAAKGSADELAAAFAEGFLLGAYRFDRYKASANGERPKAVDTVSLVGPKGWTAAKV